MELIKDWVFRQKLRKDGHFESCEREKSRPRVGQRRAKAGAAKRGFFNQSTDLLESWRLLRILLSGVSYFSRSPRLGVLLRMSHGVIRWVVSRALRAMGRKFSRASVVLAPSVTTYLFHLAEPTEYFTGSKSMKFSMSRSLGTRTSLSSAQRHSVTSLFSTGLFKSRKETSSGERLLFTFILQRYTQLRETRESGSYQEMIAHLPLNSHPNPESVLVIGGGDGGVLREVLKHPSVKRAVLCEIDEAVPRLSKRYLPTLAAGFNDPRVTVHIGDGFRFLQDKKAEFDVIITDSSDPVGPAGALFEKPYFQLLKESLKPGGNISTQGESIWLHLPLIKKLLSDTRTLFPIARYAFTSIPTYPSGTIGFVTCSLDPSRDLSQPLRKVANTKYYSSDVHRAAFCLPEFARRALSPSSQGENAKPGKKVLLLGSGFVAQPAAAYILRRPENSLTIGMRMFPLPLNL
jgi:spermidine synthase